MDTTNSIIFNRTEPHNNLPLLPPVDSIIDKDILLKWGHASRKLAELNINMLRLPNPTMLINTITLQEAKSSSEIENIFTTNDELYKAISDRVNEENANPNTKEVLRYREALWTGYKLIKEKGSIEIDIVTKILSQVINSKQSIRPPQSQTVIRRGQSEFRAGEIIYTPPRGKDIIESLLKNLFDYMNRNDATDPLLKMIIAHYQFEAIHPFIDGNGRTGRILNLLYLSNQHLLSYPVLYLSRYIINNKDDYYFCLSAVTQRNKWKNWIMFMLNAVENTAIHTNTIIDDIVNQMEATLNYARPKLKWYNKELNEVIFSQPYIKSAQIGKVLGKTSRTTLTKYANELTKLSILTPKQDGNQAYFINNDLIKIIER